MSDELFAAFLATGLSQAQVERLREIWRLNELRLESVEVDARMSSEAIALEVEESGIIGSGTPSQVTDRVMLCLVGVLEPK